MLCFDRGEVTPGELALDLRVTDEMLTVWGTVVYTIGEMGFCSSFSFRWPRRRGFYEGDKSFRGRGCESRSAWGPLCRPI
jgi:hypothetical protein